MLRPATAIRQPGRSSASLRGCLHRGSRRTVDPRNEERDPDPRSRRGRRRWPDGPDRVPLVVLDPAEGAREGRPATEVVVPGAASAADRPGGVGGDPLLRPGRAHRENRRRSPARRGRGDRHRAASGPGGPAHGGARLRRRAVAAGPLSVDPYRPDGAAVLLSAHGLPGGPRRHLRTPLMGTLRRVALALLLTAGLGATSACSSSGDSATAGGAGRAARTPPRSTSRPRAHPALRGSLPVRFPGGPFPPDRRPQKLLR